MLFLISAVVVLYFAACDAASAKRGYVADGCTGAKCTDRSLLTGAAWYYAYNPTDPYAPNGSPHFVPMHWCIANLENATIPASVNSTFLLGFNEPNNLHNCNKPPRVIAQAWETVMRLWNSSILVSPATAGNGITWYDEFFGNCTELYGAQGCNVKYIATHDYSCDPATTLAYLKNLYDRYKLPVWLTEFSCGDGAAKRPEKDHVTFMQSIFPQLDAAPHVYRYAWMSAHDANGLRGLVKADASGATVLTELGQLFNSL